MINDYWYYKIEIKGPKSTVLGENIINRYFQLIVSQKQIKCKCHGPSGSCSQKTCWYEMPEMDQVSEKLKNLYENAHQMKWRVKRGSGTGK